GGAHRLRRSREVGQDLIDWLSGEIGPLVDKTVEVVDIGAVVVVVMDLRCLGVDVRFERIVGIAKRWRRKGLRLRQHWTASGHGGHVGEGCGAAQEFQAVSSVHGLLRGRSWPIRRYSSDATPPPRGPEQ